MGSSPTFGSKKSFFLTHSLRVTTALEKKKGENQTFTLLSQINCFRSVSFKNNKKTSNCATEYATNLKPTKNQSHFSFLCIDKLLNNSYLSIKMKKEKLSFCINFLCRKCKVNQRGFAPIEMSIVGGNERCYVTLPRKEMPEQFKKLNKQHKVSDVKLYCDDLYSIANQVISRLMMSDSSVSVYDIKDGIEKIINPKAPYSIGDLFDDFLTNLKNRPITHRTWMKYIHVQEKFLFFFDKHQSPNKITKSHIEEFKLELLKEFKSTTVSGYLCKLKSVIKFGIEQKELRCNPFNGVKIPKNCLPIETISEDEFKRIHHANFRIERVRKVQEIFLFACGSGLSYIDVIALEPIDFRRQGDTFYIEKQRIKTGVTFYSVLLPCAVEIAEKYHFDLSKLKISNQKINQTLDDIQAHCDVYSIPSLTFHKARHYYITALIRRGVPIEIVQKCAGHSQIQQTMHYVHLTTRDIVNNVAMHL